MKRILFLLLFISFCSIAFAHTIRWHIDGAVYQTDTCTSGDNITPPTPPEKLGHTFVGWRLYTPLEYIQSTGTQYIDTGIAFTDALKAYPFVVDFTVALTQSYTTKTFAYFAGGPVRVMQNLQLRWGTAEGQNIYMYVSGGGQADGAGAGRYAAYEPVHLRYEFDTDGKYSISGDFSRENINLPGDNYLKTSTQTIFLFKARATESYDGTTTTAPVRVYRWSYESNGVKLRDFIPVLDINGVACMYDLVTHTFFYNAGTGNFIAGPEVGE